MLDFSQNHPPKEARKIWLSLLVEAHGSDLQNSLPAARSCSPDKDSPRIFYFHHHLKGIGSDNFHMLRCDLIGSLNGLVHGVCQKDIAEIFQGFFHDLPAGKRFQKTVYL